MNKQSEKKIYIIKTSYDVTIPAVQTANANNYTHRSIPINDNHDYDLNMEVKGNGKNKEQNEPERTNNERENHNGNVAPFILNSPQTQTDTPIIQHAD